MHCTEYIIRSGRGRLAAHDATCAGGKGAHLLKLGILTAYSYP